MDMNMNGMNTDPTIFWVFWWLFTLAAYISFAIWWSKVIKAVDKKNAERFELLKKYREEQAANSKK
jgi:hypothetical protein